MKIIDEKMFIAIQKYANSNHFSESNLRNALGINPRLFPPLLHPYYRDMEIEDELWDKIHSIVESYMPVDMFKDSKEKNIFPDNFCLLEVMELISNPLLQVAINNVFATSENPQPSRTLERRLVIEYVKNNTEEMTIGEMAEKLHQSLNKHVKKHK